ncbi:MAG: DEAD/DEAH box helicase [Candidatus Scalindua sp.]|nr:DEAD/DEAH box helicase [Candidatus Scalindua sp.]
MIDEFINNLKKLKDFKRQIVHHKTITSRVATCRELVPPLPPPLQKALKHFRITKLYHHQAEAITRVRERKNVIIATPTASGKTLAYNIPVLESILNEPESRAFYLFPIKALEQDQLRGLKKLISALEGDGITAAIYDGDTTAYKKKKLRENPPNIIITNPDMFHSSFLPYHSSWNDFFHNLKFIVIDELHTYRGVFGSHIAQVFRRINRIVEHYGGSPQYIACSATIPNPEEFASTLTGLPFEVIGTSGAPEPVRHFLFVNPAESPYTETVLLIKRLLEHNLKVIAFTKSRKITELLHTWLIQQNPAFAPYVSSYRAGFLPQERRTIEKDLFEGRIKAVISTSALEVGIDIGGLDVCILVGYPGTIINTWQRGGRAGRGDSPALIILMAQHDALDQYFMKNPEDFFARGCENAVLDPFNKPILKAHLPCAAAELPISPAEHLFDFPRIAPALEELVHSGELLRGEADGSYFSSRRRPHRFVDIRSIGEGYTIMEKGTKQIIGQVSGFRAFTECHKGAIYLHRASQYQVDSVDIERRNILVQRHEVSYFTRPKSEKETEIREVTGSKPVGNFIVRKGTIKVTEIVTGYEKRSVRGQILLSRHPLDLPPLMYETVGLWIEIIQEIELSVNTMGLHFMGGIHAIEHAVISLFPLFVLCDRNDIGGISTTFHPQVKRGAIFIYDGYPGGVGLSERGYDCIEEILTATLKLVSSCECETGCPSCIHSPKCGSGNKPLDKGAAIEVLEQLLAIKPLSPGSIPDTAVTEIPGLQMPGTGIDAIPRRRICYFDLETQRGADEVGGWRNIHLMRLALGVIYDSLDDAYHTYFEKDVGRLIEKLRSADLVVGFNVIRFDYTVLQPYTIHDLQKIKTFDILADIHTRLGYRLSLNHLAMRTLKVEKTADGLQSLKWFKEGRIDEIAHYCSKDVEITRDLFLFGNTNRYLLFEKKDCGIVRLPVEWEVEDIIRERENPGKK